MSLQKMPGIHPLVSEWEKGPTLVLHIDSPMPIFALLIHSPSKMAFRVGLFRKPGLFKPEQSWTFEVPPYSNHESCLSGRWDCDRLRYTSADLFGPTV